MQGDNSPATVKFLDHFRDFSQHDYPCCVTHITHTSFKFKFKIKICRRHPVAHYKIYQ